MAARKRKKKGKTKVISSLLSVAIVCFLSGAALGLLFLEEYVKDTARTSEDTFYLELAGVPAWVDAQLKKKVRDIAESSGGNVRFDDAAALSVQRSIEKQILRVEGRWRKPLALIRTDLVEPRYVDSQQVVLDYVPLPELPIVEVVGLGKTIDMPQPGRTWLCDDLAAATKILDRMNQMDKTFAPAKPLLFEIDRIDMRNFNGRRNEGKPHIVLYTKDNIEIIWGAEWGKWQQHLESTDQEKLAKLWGHYRQLGTLSGGVKYIYINLRDPQDKIPLPIDKY